MSRDTHITDSPLIQSREELVAYFAKGEKSANRFRIGTETEKIAYHLNDLRPVSYDGGIKNLLRGLTQFGWNPEPTLEAPLALTRDDANITLEPGGQVELSGAPYFSVHETAAELRNHLQELEAICPKMGIGFSTLGCRPFCGIDDVPWMPRDRYRIMRNYLQTKGNSGHHMMLLSAAIQANYDYSSEADMAAKMRCGMSLSPIIAALFANSPYADNRWSGWRTRRYAMWLDLDPDRCGLIPAVYDADFGYEKYLDWVIHIPMFFVKRETEFIPVENFTFSDFLEKGFSFNGEHHQPTIADFELHLSTLFPEARLKKFIEVRSADGGPPEMAVALSALCKGLFYHEPSLRKSNELLDGFGFEERVGMQRSVAQDGIRARGANWDMTELSLQIVELAHDGLVAQNKLDENGRDESCYLTVLKDVCERRQTLADDLLESFGEGPFNEESARKLFEATELEYKF